MAKVGKLHVDFEARTAKFEEGTRRATKSLKVFGAQGTLAKSKLGKLGRGLDALTGGFARFAAPVAGAVGAVAAFNKIVDDTSKYQTWTAQLETATGSIDGAHDALRRLQRFALRTPFAVDESIDAFVRLKNLGLDPSEAALTSYGNTAAAMGKSMNQMIEAVADAITGENERLKEFGIRARQTRDSVAFTFQGVTTTVGKNAKEITAYLQSIGDVNFAGAMDKQAGTLKTSFSNLAGAVSALAAKFGEESGLASSIASATQGLTNFLNVASGINARPIAEIVDAIADAEARLDRLGDRGGRTHAVRRQLSENLKELRAELATALSDLPVSNAPLKLELSKVEKEIAASRARIAKGMEDPATQKRMRGRRRNPLFIDIEAEREAIAELEARYARLDEILKSRQSARVFSPVMRDAQKAIGDYAAKFTALVRETPFGIARMNGKLEAQAAKWKKNKANVEATVEIIKALGEQWKKTTANVEETVDAIVAVDEATADAAETTYRYSTEWEDLRHGIKQTFAEGVAGGSKFRDILADVAQQWKRAMVFNILLGKKSTEDSDRSGGVLDSVGGALGGLLGGGGKSGGGGLLGGLGKVIGGIFGGGRVSGGSVSAGQVYRINERGGSLPEAFKPAVSGQVIPLGGGNTGGGMNVNITQNFNVSGGAGGMSAQDIAEAARQATMETWAEIRRRPGWA